MLKQKLHQDIKNLIGNLQIKEALDTISNNKETLFGINHNVDNQLVNLIQRFNRDKQNSMLGVLSNAELNQNRNRLIYSILTLIDAPDINLIISELPDERKVIEGLDLNTITSTLIQLNEGGKIDLAEALTTFSELFSK